MRMRIKAIAGLAAACMICAAFAAVAWATTGAATSSTRSAGTGFVASTKNGGVSIVVSRDHHQVRRAVFAYKSSCSDGDSFYDYDYFDAIPIGADRKFSYHYESAPQPSTQTPGATYTYSVSIAGMLNKAGTRIVGTARAASGLVNPAGGSYTCDTGTISFKASD